MTDHPAPLANLETDAALRAVLEGTATDTGEQFFASLVRNLAKALGTHGAWVTEYFPERRRLRALAFWMDGQWIKDYEVDIAGSPCEQVIDTQRLVHFPDRLLELYPNEPDVVAIGAVSYMGAPLLDTDGRILGHMAVIDRRPLPVEPRVHALFQIFAARAAAELQRLRAEADVREREEKVGRLLNSAMDAIIELDDRLRVTRVNPATEKVFRCPAANMTGQDFRAFLSREDAARLPGLIAELDGRPEGQQSRWIPGGLTARCPEGGSFPAEATLSRFELHRRKFTTVILRNIHDRVEAEADHPVPANGAGDSPQRIAGLAGGQRAHRREPGSAAGLARHCAGGPRRTRRCCSWARPARERNSPLAPSMPPVRAGSAR